RVSVRNDFGPLFGLKLISNVLGITGRARQSPTGCRRRGGGRRHAGGGGTRAGSGEGAPQGGWGQWGSGASWAPGKSCTGGSRGVIYIVVRYFKEGGGWREALQVPGFAHPAAGGRRPRPGGTGPGPVPGGGPRAERRERAEPDVQRPGQHRLGRALQSGRQQHDRDAGGRLRRRGSAAGRGRAL